MLNMSLLCRMHHITLNENTRNKCKQAKDEWLNKIFAENQRTEQRHSKQVYKDKRNSKTENALFEKMYKIFKKEQ